MSAVDQFCRYASVNSRDEKPNLAQSDADSAGDVRADPADSPTKCERPGDTQVWFGAVVHQSRGAY